MVDKNGPRRPRLLLGAAFLVIAAGILVLTAWPVQYKTDSAVIETDILPEGYRLEIQYPAACAAGEPVELSVEILPPVYPVGSHADPTRFFIILDWQSTSISLDPPGSVILAAPSEQAAGLSWQMIVPEPGSHRLSLFLSVQSVEKEESPPQPVWAKSYQLTGFAGLGTWKNPLLFLASFILSIGLLLVLFSLPAARNKRPR